MHPIYAMWVTPRSTSTAFEWMMRMRGDLHCFHEPHSEAWYQGDDAGWPRLVADSPRQPGLTTAGVIETVRAVAEKGPVFVKDMANATPHLWSDDWLGAFRHSFLIRDPEKVYPSVHKNWPDFHDIEIGFDALRELFDRVRDLTGQTPPVVDSDDLLERPYGIVAAYCAALGIPFVPAALRWEPGDRGEVLWYDTDDVWHKNLKNSTGLMRQPRVAGRIADEPPRVREAVCCGHGALRVLAPVPPVSPGCARATVKGRFPSPRGKVDWSPGLASKTEGAHRRYRAAPLGTNGVAWSSGTREGSQHYLYIRGGALHAPVV